MQQADNRIVRLLLRWRAWDSKFRHNRARYVAQCLLATLTMLAVLLALDSVRQTVLIASLGASTFIVFAMPRSYQSKPRYVLGGYLVGTLAGCSMSVAAIVIAWAGQLELHTAQLIAGTLAAGLSFFLMVLSQSEHPPAAAVALGYVLNDWDGGTILVVLGGATLLCIVKELLRPQLMDLI